jgi:hypothetical protein
VAVAKIGPFSRGTRRPRGRGIPPGLRERGYIEGRTLSSSIVLAREINEQPALAELVRLNVDVIFT